MIADPGTTLTQRQLEYIALAASGYTYAQIAGMKYVSVATVKNTLARSRVNMCVDSLTHLCAVCVEAGVIVKNGQGFKPVVDPTVADSA